MLLVGLMQVQVVFCRKQLFKQTDICESHTPYNLNNYLNLPTSKKQGIDFTSKSYTSLTTIYNTFHIYHSISINLFFTSSSVLDSNKNHSMANPSWPTTQITPFIQYKNQFEFINIAMLYGIYLSILSKRLNCVLYFISLINYHQ